MNIIISIIIIIMEVKKDYTLQRARKTASQPCRWEPCLNSLTAIFNILFEGKLPEEWMLSSLVQIIKRKGDSLSPNSYTGIKLLEHTFKVLDR